MINCMWNVIITSSSVGYGELYPKTFFGRIVGVVICFWGIFTVSFFVVVVTQLLEFSESEEKSYNLLLRLYHKSALKRDAVAVLSSAFVHRNAKLTQPENSSLILSMYRNFRSMLLQFQTTARVVRGLNESDKDVDIMHNILFTLIERVDDLKHAQEKNDENIGKIMNNTVQTNSID